MKIQLPNGIKLNLDENITLEQKLKKVEDLTNEWRSAIERNWDSNTIRFFLDGLANYLVWHKDEDDKNKHNKDMISNWKIEQMEGKRKTNSIPFSSLSTINKELLGLEGNNDGKKKN
ncbi:hypothetical protein NSQ93_22660 [Bacillus sp. FSL W8-0445]|uniref:hypothetical protein n=1 Tax=Bacillota TaxID=1239 RepID=UPI000779B997|nr:MULTISPECIES: hypothetical protein [Bacillota]MDE1406989.1 hypothetical protein [Bacillus licheniformis]NFT30749.1 hypothetical protein [Clostridium sporogenes]GIN25566.1 hypothetical protein J31TS2_21460 [Bacillus licheniformis]GIN29695.1 hypothetical protein J2TS5_17340 [Bacillus licheniformis]